MEREFLVITTNFEKVMIFNRAFDMVDKIPQTTRCYSANDTVFSLDYTPLKYFRKSLFVDKPNIIKLRLDLIKEEIGELNDAINTTDIIEQRDACADILYVVYGMADVLGIAINDIFNHNILEILKQYYINNNSYKQQFSNKLLSANRNRTQIITNFNYVKHFLPEILGYDYNTKLIPEMINIVYTKLHTIYTKLEEDCIIDTLNFEEDSEYYYNKQGSISNNIYQLLLWTYIMTLVIGANADQDFSIVHESNMSKLCDTEDDANRTVLHYNEQYNNGNSPYDSPYYYYLPDIDKWIVKNKSSGKALKNIKYKHVCFTNSRFVY